MIVDDEGGIVGGAQHNAALARAAQTPLIGLYPLTGKLRTWTVAECAGLALETLAGMADPVPAWVRDAAGVVDLETAFRYVHPPQDTDQIERGRERLRFDEAFGLQLTMAYRRADAAAHRAEPRPRRTGGLLDAFDARLPFTLTRGQERGQRADLRRAGPAVTRCNGCCRARSARARRWSRCGPCWRWSTPAARRPCWPRPRCWPPSTSRPCRGCSATWARAGRSARWSTPPAIVLITGSQSAAQRREATLRAASGEAGIVIGTHALLSAGVQFADLGLVVVDEQHRFGVEQRAALSAKAVSRPHVLVMTATPIPRSVAMTVFGDLETATLRELPAGRAEVSTVVVDARRHPAWVQRAWQRIVEEVGAGRQAYVVCARISRR